MKKYERSASHASMIEEKKYRYYAMEIAEQFHYGTEVIEAIKNAKNDDEISNIMCKARKKLL